MLLGDRQAAFSQYKTADVSMFLVSHGISAISFLFGTVTPSLGRYAHGPGQPLDRFPVSPSPCALAT
jgi:hypothetical protein